MNEDERIAGSSNSELLFTVCLRCSLGGLTVRCACASATILMQRMGAAKPDAGLAIEIGDIAGAVRLFALACTAAQAENAGRMLVSWLVAQAAHSGIILDQKRRQRNRLPARHAAHTPI